MTLFFGVFITCPPVQTFCKMNKVYKKEGKNKIERQHPVHTSTLLKNKTHWVKTGFFQKFSLLDHLSTLFCQNSEEYKIFRRNKIERQLLFHKSTFSSNKIKEIETFFRIFINGPPVHTFLSKLWRLHNRKKIWNRKTPFCPHVHTFK